MPGKRRRNGPASQPSGIFSFLKRPFRTSKPRTSGLTMVEGDFMLAVAGMSYVEDLMEWAGPCIDYYKVGVGMMSQPRDLVTGKLALLKEDDVHAYLGGSATEEAIRQACHEEMWKEAKALGIDTIEVSDTVQPLSMAQKVKLIGKARGMGFTVFAEVGKKLIGAGGPKSHMPISEVIRQMKECLNAGAFKIVYEHTEVEDIYEKGAGLGVLLEVAGSVGADNIMFEVPINEWKTVSPYMSFYVEHFGTNVNVGDVDPKFVSEFENIRLGFSPRVMGKVAPI
ncbi:MAG: phosphosulfolactate synthase [Chloroflexi bacterium]|nr:phosphosulfolactate synthase [Chloroflexota bacterium]